jgi:hypothetical protein
MPHKTTLLGPEAGIQYQGTRDSSSSKDSQLINDVYVGKFRRGRFDRPMNITAKNIRTVLGYDPRNLDYAAVQDALNTGINSLQVLRITDSASQTTPQLRIGTKFIDRFDPKYWRVDGPQTMSFTTTSFDNGFEVLFKSRMSNDLVGIIWDTEDKKDHKLLAYESNFNYSGLIWEFDIELSPSMPALNDEQKAITLTIKYIEEGEEKTAYVALYNYADFPVGHTSTISINFDEIKAGFYADQPFPVNKITQMFFAGITSSYVGNKVLGADGLPTSEEVAPYPLEAGEVGYLRITNSQVSGTGAKLLTKVVQVPVHDLGMCTSFDDHYDLNPQRLVDNMQALGYQGFINHYCGMSHYPEMYWNGAINKWQIPDTLVTNEDVVNPCTIRWHEAYAKALNDAGFTPVFSVSFEMYSQAGNEFWAQRDINDALGRTGYEPPSYFFSLCHANALAYLHKAFKEFAATMVTGGCEVNMQIGEPWWWFNTATNLPCVYDYQTRLAFNADTGLYAPDLGTIYEAINKTGTPYDEFKTWLRNKLGQTCRDIRTMIKQIYPSAKVCPLIFFPSIRTHNESLATYINYPSEHYKYPNFDYIMTEAYDWILEGRLDLTKQAVNEIPLEELDYPADKVAYLVGFVPDSAIAYLYGFDDTKEYRPPIWQRILGDKVNNNDVGVMKQLVWAYPQVMFDSMTIDKEIAPNGFFLNETYFEPVTDNTPYPPEIFL